MLWHFTHAQRADVIEDDFRLKVVLDDSAAVLVNVTSSDMAVWHSEVFISLDDSLNAAAQRYHTQGTATRFYYTRGTATCILELSSSACRREARGR